MNLLPKMRDEASRRDRYRALRIELRARAHPPRPRNNVNKPVIRMEVRMAHVMRGPFHQDNVQTRLFRIAEQNRRLRASWTVLPLDLLRQSVGYGCRV